MNVHPGDGDALLVTDVQNDFLPGGALAVPNGDSVISPLNRAISCFKSASLPIIATRDWHPEHHCSFRERGGPWPPHCVQNTGGALFSARLELPADRVVISKATDPDHEAYSAFSGTDLDQKLRELKIRRIFIGGLATDYCVLWTSLDALKLGYEVLLLEDAVQGIDARPGASQSAIDALSSQGVTRTTTRELEDRRGAA